MTKVVQAFAPLAPLSPRRHAPLALTSFPIAPLSPTLVQPKRRRPPLRCAIADPNGDAPATVAVVVETKRKAKRKAKSKAKPKVEPEAVSKSEVETEAASESEVDTGTRKRRTQSAECRAKISAALKGKPKSLTHRETLSKRFEGNGNPMYGRTVSAETRAKISRSMHERHRKVTAAAQAAGLPTKASTTAAASKTQSNAAPRKRRPMSAESRAKISAALKGRRKSESHRENLRKRFGGDGNPMYGRKLSVETRGKISRSLIERRRKGNLLKKEGEPAELAAEEASGSEELDGLKAKAMQSRLVDSLHKNGGSKRKDHSDSWAFVDLDSVLERVARLDAPPENVERLLDKNRQERKDRSDDETEAEEVMEESVVTNIGNEEKKDGSIKDDGSESEVEAEDDTKCGRCNGSGLISCANCVGAFGVVSARCETCFGAGAVFCEDCQGVGLVKL